MKMRWKQRGDDYELNCPCCRLPIAMIYKREGQFVGEIYPPGSHDLIVGKSFVACRAAVNKRVEEILNK